MSESTIFLQDVVLCHRPARTATILNAAYFGGQRVRGKGFVAIVVRDNRVGEMRRGLGFYGRFTTGRKTKISVGITVIVSVKIGEPSNIALRVTV